MKSSIKASSVGLFVLLLIAGTLTFLARETKSPLSPGNITAYPDFETTMVADTRDFAASFDASKPFDFHVEMTMCKTALPRISLRIVIDELTLPDKLVKPDLYRYKWETNGTVVGTNATLPCFPCTKAIVVTVTRVSDNMSIRKTIRLWPCWNKESSSPTYNL